MDFKELLNEGDTVFVYVGASVPAVMYKYKMLETGIHYEYENKARCPALVDLFWVFPCRTFRGLHAPVHTSRLSMLWRWMLSRSRIWSTGSMRTGGWWRIKKERSLKVTVPV